MSCNCEGKTYNISLGCCTHVLGPVENYYTKSQVDKLIEDINVSGVTEEELDEKIASAKTEIENEIPTVPTSNTAFTNDAGYLTQHQSLDGYATEQWVEDKHYITGVDLSNYATLQDIPTSNTAFTNDAGYLTEHQSLEDYATTAYVNTQISSQTADFVSGEELSSYTYDKSTIDSKIAQGGSFDPTLYYDKTATDALLAEKLDTSAYTPTDLSNYYTKSETSGATQISTALASKADKATTYTKTEVDNVITAATSTKQDTLVSGTNIKTINNESILGSGNINIQGGGGGGTVESAITSGSTNAVESSAIYDATHIDLIDLWTSTDKYNLKDTTQSLYKFYLQYTGDTALDKQVTVEIVYGSNNTWETLSGNVFQETATTSSVFTSTFDNGKWIIESSSPNYIRQIFADYRFRIWSYNRTIGNKFAADSIENDIIPYIGDAVTKAENAVAIAGLAHNGSKELGIFFTKGNGNTSSVMVTFDDLKYSNQILSTDIQIPTGEIGWSEITPQDNCNAGDMPTNKVKVTYSGQTVSASARGISFRAFFKRTDGNASNYYPRITWSDTTTPTVDGCSAVTATYDSTDDSVIIELPSGETTYDGNTGTFSIKELRSNSCQFGTGISSVKYYGDITEDIYTAMAHKQDTLSAGTGIEISGNVISATGGGGATYTAGDGIQISGNTISTTTKFQCLTEQEWASVSGNPDTNTVYFIR